MKKYLIRFLHRGAVFGGFGPIIFGIICFCIQSSGGVPAISGGRLLLGIVSCYLLAFLHAGASVFNQIDEWPITKGMLFHFATLYVSYVFCYLINSWLPFRWQVIAIFTLIFVTLYCIIWLIVWLSVRGVSKKLNLRLGK